MSLSSTTTVVELTTDNSNKKMLKKEKSSNILTLPTGILNQKFGLNMWNLSRYSKCFIIKNLMFSSQTDVNK